jgi:hypothetical protein
MAVTLDDAFTRANSATTVGSPTTGPAPVIQLGTLGITTNRLYTAVLASQGTPGNAAIVTWAIGPTFDLTYHRNGNVAIVFGWVGLLDHWLIQWTNDLVNLYRCVVGGYALIQTVPMDDSLVTVATPLRVTYANHVLRIFSNGIEGIERAFTDGEDAAWTSAIGVRFTTAATSTYVEDILVNSLATDSLAFASGEIRDQPTIAAIAAIDPGYSYLGTDTAITDGALPT